MADEPSDADVLIIPDSGHSRCIVKPLTEAGRSWLTGCDIYITPESWPDNAIVVPVEFIDDMKQDALLRGLIVQNNIGGAADG